MWTEIASQAEPICNGGARCKMGGALDNYVEALLERRKNAPVSEGDREFFLTEVRLLKEKLNHAELRVEELVAENRSLGSTLGTSKVDQKDIFEYLNGELAKKTDTIVRLEEGVQALEEDNANLVSEYEAKLASREDANAAEREVLEKSIAGLTAHLDELNEFRARKEDLERDTAQVKATLEDERREHQRQIAELERKHVQEKDRLKKEMLVKLRETKATLHKMTANQLDTTTKRTIAENEQISSELAWQSKEAEKLAKRNEKLAEEVKGLRRELELHKQMEGEFARKVHVYQKTIKTLLAKLNSLDLLKRSEAETLTHAEEEIERVRALANSQVESLEEEATRLRMSMGSAESEVEHLRAELERARALAEQRERATDDGVRFLLECLNDARAELSRARPSVVGSELAQGSASSAAELGGESSVVVTGSGSGLAGESGLGGGSGQAPLDGGESRLSEARGGQLFDSSLLSAEPSQLAMLKDPEQREAVLGSVLGRLQTYQKQLAELSLHREWRAIQRGALEQRREGRTEGSVPLPRTRASPERRRRACSVYVCVCYSACHAAAAHARACPHAARSQLPTFSDDFEQPSCAPPLGLAPPPCRHARSHRHARFSRRARRHPARERGRSRRAYADARPLRLRAGPGYCAGQGRAGWLWRAGRTGRQGGCCQPAQRERRRARRGWPCAPMGKTLEGAAALAAARPELYAKIACEQQHCLSTAVSSAAGGAHRFAQTVND